MGAHRLESETTWLRAVLFICYRFERAFENAPDLWLSAYPLISSDVT